MTDISRPHEACAGRAGKAPVPDARIPFTHVDGRHLHNEIVAQVQALVRDGTLKPGDRLPSEAELCQVFGVSRSVLREAFSALRHAGVLEMRQGVGTFVAGRALESLKGAPRPPLPAEGQASVGNLLALMEVRMALEPQAARLAAERATPRDIEQLEKAFEAMRRAVEAGSVGAEEDYAFHHALSEATHNAVFEWVLDLMSDLFIRSIWVSRSRSLQFHARPLRVLREHEAVLDAVRRRDPGQAARAMRAHLQGARRRLIDERGRRTAPPGSRQRGEPSPLRTAASPVMVASTEAGASGGQVAAEP